MPVLQFQLSLKRHQKFWKSAHALREERPVLHVCPCTIYKLCISQKDHLNLSQNKLIKNATVLCNLLSIRFWYYKCYSWIAFPKEKTSTYIKTSKMFIFSMFFQPSSIPDCSVFVKNVHLKGHHFRGAGLNENEETFIQMFNVKQV